MVLVAEQPPQQKRSLFKIGEDFEALEKILAECDGDISDPVALAAVEAWIGELATDRAVKCDAYVAIISKWEMEASLARAESEQFAAAAAKARERAVVRDNRVDRLKTRLKEHMLATKTASIETASGRTIAVQKNGGKLPLFVDPTVVPETLPKKFQKVVIQIDNEAVRKACEEAIATADMFVGIGMAMEHLRTFPEVDVKREAKVLGVDLQDGGVTLEGLQRLIIHLSVPFAHLGQRGTQLRIR